MFSLVLAVLFSTTAAPTADDARVGSGPEPSPTPVAWEFEFEFTHPQRIAVQLPGHTSPTVYWYMVYTVTNPGHRTQPFFPLFQLVTEDLRVIDTDMGISPLVFQAIKERHRLTHRYLMHPTKVIGDLKTGDDHARQSVAIWRAGELNVNSFTVFVAGLSGETRFIANPEYDPDRPQTATVVGKDGRGREIDVNPQHFTLRKTLELCYALPGSERARGSVKPVFLTRRWIMR